MKLVMNQLLRHFFFTLIIVRFKKCIQPSNFNNFFTLFLIYKTVINRRARSQIKVKVYKHLTNARYSDIFEPADFIPGKRYNNTQSNFYKEHLASLKLYLFLNPSIKRNFISSIDTFYIVYLTSFNY